MTFEKLLLDKPFKHKPLTLVSTLSVVFYWINGSD